jgi:hypothetical protein
MEELWNNCRKIEESMALMTKRSCKSSYHIRYKKQPNTELTYSAKKQNNPAELLAGH